MDDEELGFYKVSTSRKILQALQDWERKTTSEPDQGAQLRSPIYFRNDSGHTIPAYGVMQITGTFEETFNYLTAKRPYDYTAVQSVPMVNGPFEVVDGDFGTAQNGPVYRVIHDAATTYAVNDRVGYKTDSFKVAFGPLFRVLGEDDVETDCLRVVRDDSALIAVVASGGIAANGSGNVTVKKADSTHWTSASRTHKAYTVGSAIAEGDNVVIWPCDGRWLALKVC